MKHTGFFLLLLATVAYAAPQSMDELHIPEENDNQFPPDNNMEIDGSSTEGSGAGAIEDPIYITTTTESTLSPVLENVQLLNSEVIEPTDEKSENSCPKPCVCHIEGDSFNYVVDCSGYDLTELPQSIDTKTTTLNIQNNKLTEIPKEISLLKNLKVLNAGNNSIMKLASGSISELPELTILKLSNNRLIDYPQDLKNSFGLTKLEELDLGGNDMRTPLNRDTFLHFTALKKLTLPTDTKELLEDVCSSLKESLITICTESCSVKAFECPEAPQEDALNFILPGAIALSTALEDNKDLVIPENIDADSDNVDITGASKVQAGTESIADSDKVDTIKTQEEQAVVETNDDSNSVDPIKTSEVQTGIALNVDSNKIDTTDAPGIHSGVSSNMDSNIVDTAQASEIEGKVDSNVDLEKVDTTEAPETQSGVESTADSDTDFSESPEIQTKLEENTTPGPKEISPLSTVVEAPKMALDDHKETDISQTNGLVTPQVTETNAGPEISLRSAVSKAEGISPLSTIVETSKGALDDHKDAEVAVGATTSGTNTGGVDKSVIGMIVAGMVVIVAGITIKKNWSSIRNRFSSPPRAAANERTGVGANGTAPEEVPLQEKSPV